MMGLRPNRSEAGPYSSGSTARVNTKALIVSPTSEALALSAAPVAESAGKLMSIPEYGTPARKPSSSVKVKEVDWIRMMWVSDAFRIGIVTRG